MKETRSQSMSRARSRRHWLLWGLLLLIPLLWPAAKPAHALALRAAIVIGPTRVREAAARRLGFLGAVACGPLMLGLRDPDPFIRAQSARALGRLGREAEPARELLRELLSDPDWGVRYHAAGTLGRLAPDESLRPELEALLLKPDGGLVEWSDGDLAWVRYAAERSLERLDEAKRIERCRH
jgi:HEAT repeat protein